MHIKIKGMTLNNWLHFYLSEPRVLAEAAGCKSCFCTGIDFSDQAYSHVERHAYELFVVEILRIHPSFSTAVWNIRSQM